MKNRSKSSAARAIKKLRENQYSLYLSEKEEQYNCPHKLDNGTLRIKAKKMSGKKGNKAKEGTIFVCRECREKIDFSYLKDFDPKELKHDLKEWIKQGHSFCNFAKLQTDKHDKELVKKIAKGMKSITFIGEISKVLILKDASKFTGKGKNRGRRRSNNMRITAGGKSIFR